MGVTAQTGIVLDRIENATLRPRESTGESLTAGMSTSPFSFCIDDNHTSFPGPKHPGACGCAERQKSLGDRHFCTARRPLRNRIGDTSG